MRSQDNDSFFKSKDELDFESLLYVLLENLNLLISVFLVSIFGCFIYFVSSTPLYKSISLIEVQKEESFFPSIGSGLESAFSPSSSLEAEIEIYKSDSTVRDTLDNLENQNFFDEIEKPSISKIKENLVLKGNRNSLIEISLVFDDKFLLKKILNEMNNEYIKDRKEFKQRSSSLGREFVKNEIPRIKNLLEEAEDRFNKFKLSTNSVGLIFESDNRVEQLNRLQERIREINFKEFELKEFYKENHPIYVTLLKQKNLLKEQVSDIEKDLPNVPDNQRKIENLKREVELYSGVLKDLSSQEIVLAMTEASSLSNIRIINEASDGLRIEPGTTVFILPFLISFFLYLFLFIRYFMQDKISNLDALIDYVGKDKVIGEYPLMYDNENLSYVKNLANEMLNKASYEILNNAEGDFKHFLIAGSRKDVGKTEISFRLINKFISLNKKACFIDFDYRKGDLTKRFYPDEKIDIKNFEDFYKQKDKFMLGNSLFIPYFNVSDPIEFFTNENFESEISKLKEEYEYIFCDTPPWSLFVDAKILSKHFEDVIYIVGNKVSSFRDIHLFTNERKSNTAQKDNKVTKFFFNKFDLFYSFLWLKYNYPYYSASNYYDYYGLPKEKSFQIRSFYAKISRFLRKLLNIR